MKKTTSEYLDNQRYVKHHGRDLLSNDSVIALTVWWLSTWLFCRITFYKRGPSVVLAVTMLVYQARWECQY